MMRHLSLLAIFLLFCVCSVAEVHQIPIRWKASMMTRMMREGKWADMVTQLDLLRATGYRPIDISSPQKIYDYMDSEYVGNITIGSPDQPFTVILDTAAGDLFIDDIACKSLPGCTGKDMFDKTKSRTYEPIGQPFNFTVISGYLGKDTMRFGSAGGPQISIPRQIFGQGTFVNEMFKNDIADGALGLGFSSLSKFRVYPPVINAINQGLLDQPVFTTYLKGGHPSDEGDGGVLTLGAIDTVNCGPIIAYQPLTAASYYRFKLDAVSVGSYSNYQGWQAISDTSSAFMGAPQPMVDGIANSLGAHFDTNDQVYYVDCGTPAQLYLTIGGKKYTVTTGNFIKTIAPNKCILAIFAFDGAAFGQDWILGAPFMREYCNIHDIGRQRIGFAMAK